MSEHNTTPKTISREYTNMQWQIPRFYDPSNEINIPLCKEIRAILFRRGIINERDIDEYINPKLLDDPLSHFPDLQKAIERIALACQNGEDIAICGDYDADGMTSTALLTNVLLKLGAKVNPIIPDRLNEGYGLNTSIIEHLSSLDNRLLITVDNGVSSIEALKLAIEYGIDVILSDHHTVNDKLPNIYALIHPHLTPDNSQFRNLAGVGLAYIIGSELLKYFNFSHRTNIALDLFCIGTIADVSILTGVNRIYLKMGLSILSQTESLGLQELFKVSGVKKKDINSDDIGYKIAPRINAVGRIDNPKIILDLLTSNSSKKCRELADRCNKINIERRRLSSSIEQEALSIINSDINNLSEFILIGKDTWHPGILGIVAARISEIYNRPTGLWCKSKENILRFSIRSPEWFSAIKALDKCKCFLMQYGGHKSAAGFTLKKQDLDKVSKMLNQEVLKEKDSKYEISYKPEALVELININKNLIEDLSLLEPFGNGNPKPLFWSRGCKVISKYMIGSKHLRILLEDNNGARRKGIIWNYKLRQLGIIENKIDILFYIVENNWKNKNEILLDILDYRTYSEFIYIYKSKKKYLATIEDDYNISIKNSKNEKIYYDFKNDEIHSDIKLEKNKYLDELINDCMMALGLNS